MIRIPRPSSTLRWVLLCRIVTPVEQRMAWLRQIELAVSFLQAGQASLARYDCKGNIAEQISITNNGEARLRTIHFGDVENYRGSFSFVPHEPADRRFLAELRRFLKIDGGTAIKPEPFNFLGLPSEVVNNIYEILLVFPGRTRWLWGYRHQTDASATAGFLHGEIPRLGLLRASRRVRRESLSLLVGQNNLLLDAVWLTSFLESSTQVEVDGHLERVMVGSYLKRITLTVTLTWQKQIGREEAKGIKALVQDCPSLEQVDVFIYNRRAWYWESDMVWAELTRLPNVRVEEHFEGNSPLTQLGTSTVLMLD